MVALLVALSAAYGVFLLYTSLVFGWRGLRVGPSPTGRSVPLAFRRRVREWLVQAGLPDVAPRDLVAATVVCAGTGVVGALALFGGVVPGLVAGVLAASVPTTAYRQRRRSRRSIARDAWPGLIEEIRVLTNAGRSVPQALFEVGSAAPSEMSAAFEAARREWLVTTDFGRTVGLLKSHLADASADAVLETLLVAHGLGSTDLDQRLEALADDRRTDVEYRSDVGARQAGVRFARRFVLLVPLGLAFAGLSVGNGRAAYETPFGQAAVVTALTMVAACWVWAGRIMRLPEAPRVLHR